MADTIKIGNLDISAFKVGSDDCKVYLGDTLLYPQQTVSYKLIAQYSDTTEYKVECDGNAVLTATEVSGHTTPITAMTSAVVGACDGQGSYKIGDNAFSGAGISSITIDDNVTIIGNQSFVRTRNLKSITFPSGLTQIQGSCFRFSGIKKFDNKIPSGVTSLGSGCFADMYSLSSATIPATVTGSSNNIFLRDSGLTQVHFERRTAPELGADAFKNCTALVKIYIPDCDCYNSYAAQSQFSGYTQLIYGEDGTKCAPVVRNYRMKRYLKSGQSNTTNCDSSSAITSGDVRATYAIETLTGSTSGLTKVEIGDCVKSISGNSFYLMQQLSSITLSDSVTTLGASAFSIADSAVNRIHDVDLGKGLKTIGRRAFRYIGASYSSNQASVTIPKSVTKIDECAFINGRFRKLEIQNGGSITVEASAFTECGSNAGVSIATNSVKSIGTRAFQYFSGLTSVSFSGVTSISNEGCQFISCRSLRSVEIRGNGTVKIPKYFFNESSAPLSSVTLSGISEISNSIGLGSSGASTRILKMMDTTPPTIGTTSISAYNPTVIYVPSSAVNTYKTATNWSAYASIIQGF